MTSLELGVTPRSLPRSVSTNDCRNKCGTTDNQQDSFDDEVDLGYRGVYVRKYSVSPMFNDHHANIDTGGDPTEPFDVIEPTLPTEAIVPAKPAKRGIKSVFKNVKAVFKQRNNSG